MFIIASLRCPARFHVHRRCFNNGIGRRYLLNSAKQEQVAQNTKNQDDACNDEIESK